MAGSKVAVCPGVPAFPDWANSSKKYRDLFNGVAREKNYPIEWVQDTSGGATNLPDLALGEVVVDAQRPDFKVTKALLCEIRSVVEGRRQEVGRASHDQLRIVKSDSLSDRVQKIANPAERAWLAATADEAQEISLDVFGNQSNPAYAQMEAWMRAGKGEKYSTHHFLRMRGIKPPKIENPAVLKFEKPEEYANNFEWFQEPPSMGNSLLPADFTKEELEYINATYAQDDPIRLPWTVVERTTQPAETQRANSIVNEIVGGSPVSWIVKGKDDRWYKVTNMAFHPAYRPLFQRFAALLREKAFIKVKEGEKTYELDPQFRKYTLTMADCLERGEFLKLLQADLDQTEGKLFFTFFPHEGYWTDQIKLPWMMEMGIRERVGQAMPPQEAAIFQELEDDYAEIAGANGLKYDRRAINVNEVAKSVVLFWPYRNGGFMRAYYREPLGHDYPTRTYPGINLHRTVTIMDGTVATVEPTNEIIKRIVRKDGVVVIHAEDLVTFIKWHEGQHGVGARKETATDSGKSFSDVYGTFWGAVAEPFGDTGSAFALVKRHEKGIIDDTNYRENVVNIFGQQVRRLYPKAICTDLEMMANPDAAHIIGAAVFLGWLIRKKVAEITKDGEIVLKVKDWAPAVRELYAEYVKFSLTDNLPAYQQFVRDNVGAIPDDLEKKILGLKAQFGRPLLINRNPKATGKPGVLEPVL